MRRPTLFALALPLALLACSKDKEPPPSGERTEDPIPETPKDAPTGPFAGFDFDAAAARWQGAWTLQNGGRKVAWSIESAKLTEFDGEHEQTYEFAIDSPCQLTYTDTDAGLSVHLNFALVGDELHVGSGAAGTVVGEAIVACIDGRTFVRRGDECREWSAMFGDWKSSPADCSLAGEGPERKLLTQVGELPFVSDTALASAPLQDNLVVAHADFATAKAARNE